MIRRVPLRATSTWWRSAAAFLFAAATVWFGNPLGAAADEPQPQTVRLWKEAAPGAKGSEPRDIPKLHVYLLEGDAPRSTIIIFPGGGYGALAMDHEGTQMARFFNQLGMNAFILDYRHAGKGYRHPVPWTDARRAVRLVRHRAAEWHVDRHRVGIIGFSAGGHLASTLSTHFDLGRMSAEDRVQRESCRPDFAILCYPVIGLGKPYTHRGSQRNLLGSAPDPKLVAEFSNEDRVTRDTPPTFLWHTRDDRAVPVANSVHYFEAMVRHGVPGELHVFQKGRHGLGLAQRQPGASAWPKLLEAWLKQQGILPGAGGSAK